MRRCLLGIAIAGSACTSPGTDPDAVEAIRFDGAAYPSITVGDSLRDSLGVAQRVRAVGLNFKGDEVAGAEFVYSSPDTNLRLNSAGGVFARSRKTDGSPARIFATVGSLQSVPDSLFTAPRADSIKATVVADTVFGAQVSRDEVTFTVFGDTAAGKPKLAVQGWLVSFQLQYRGVLLAPTDTTGRPFAANVGTRVVPSFVDTTDGSGRVGRKLVFRTPRTPEDTVFVIATIRQRKSGSDPIRTQTRVIYRPGDPPEARVTPP
ncbi:MAG TPA: hypothetical protein VM076_22665 [Gemmatimonadaceae bacterium]|nr:hypothetical protein [Gemmatimonadaceae bacterium]